MDCDTMSLTVLVLFLTMLVLFLKIVWSLLFLSVLIVSYCRKEALRFLSSLIVEQKLFILLSFLTMLDILLSLLIVVIAVPLILGFRYRRKARPPTRIDEDAWVTYSMRDLIVATNNFSDSNLVGEGGFGSWITYPVRDLIVATNNFSDSNLVGEGGFGRVYRADLGGNRIGAIKRLREVDSTRFGKELSILLRVPRHPNLVNLLRICSDPGYDMIVSEYVANGTLFSRLHENQGVAGPLSWTARKEIARQVAESLRHLHEQAQIIHRDVKSKNVLLENDFSAKLADFGIAKLGPGNNRSTDTTARGTFGYMDPQCVSEHRCSAKSDVYSFGVVIGTDALVIRTRTDRLSRDTNNMIEMVDQSLPDRNNRNELLGMIEIANLWLERERGHRPSMAEVVNFMDYI